MEMQMSSVSNNQFRFFFLRAESHGLQREMPTHRLVIVRHGESTWNQENRFCGWFDAELSEKGKEEAQRGAQAVKDAGYEFDICYTSVLKRAIRTLWYIMDGIDQMWLPVVRTWRLNERHYGGLTGLNKAETAAKHGEEQVKIWRRSYDVPPPPMDEAHPYYQVISKARRYASLKPGDLPSCESLKDTIARALPFWNDEIAPQIKAGKRAAEGCVAISSLELHYKTEGQGGDEGMSDAAIMELNLPTGIPIVYELDDHLKPIKPMQFLGDEETVRKAMEAVAAQGKACLAGSEYAKLFRLSIKHKLLAKAWLEKCQFGAIKNKQKEKNSAFKNFEHLARQDDDRRQQELEEKTKKREEDLAAAEERVKVPAVAEEVEINSAVEHDSTLDGGKALESEEPVEEKAEAEATSTAAELPVAIAAPTETKPTELPR
ncbi:hypothetical protein JD844_031262 [Phrynosoma platyrhinos]|uniref:Phosphoglycerate mutase n=1 Tax=Phrynosoma platyrhinos TaxID=52577 RepID=A0ABQ7T0F2_PHRPL|nr:hypothetical protein JD844_031262 [Phrynosoma platyrhinos]